MPKERKITKKVFAGIISDENNIAEYEKFLRLTDEESTILDKLKKIYSDYIKSNQDFLKTVGKLEEIIIQIRCKNVIRDEIKLVLTKKYIYARSLFFRKGLEINDIRSLIGKTSVYGNSIEALEQNKDFMDLCVEKLSAVMENEINKNLAEIYNVFYNYKDADECIEFI